VVPDDCVRVLVYGNSEESSDPRSLRRCSYVWVLAEMNIWRSCRRIEEEWGAHLAVSVDEEAMEGESGRKDLNWSGLEGYSDVGVVCATSRGTKGWDIL
jgi:hypothetical protein